MSEWNILNIIFFTLVFGYLLFVLFCFVFFCNGYYMDINAGTAFLNAALLSNTFSFLYSACWEFFFQYFTVFWDCWFCYYCCCCLQQWFFGIQSTADNSNLQGKSGVRVIGSSKKIAESKVKNSFYCTMNILITFYCRNVQWKLKDTSRL